MSFENRSQQLDFTNPTYYEGTTPDDGAETAKFNTSFEGLRAAIEELRQLMEKTQGVYGGSLLIDTTLGESWNINVSENIIKFTLANGSESIDITGNHIGAAVKRIIVLDKWRSLVNDSGSYDANGESIDFGRKAKNDWWLAAGLCEQVQTSRQMRQSELLDTVNELLLSSPNAVSENTDVLARVAAGEQVRVAKTKDGDVIYPSNRLSLINTDTGLVLVKQNSEVANGRTIASSYPTISFYANNDLSGEPITPSTKPTLYVTFDGQNLRSWNANESGESASERVMSIAEINWLLDQLKNGSSVKLPTEFVTGSSL